MDCGQLSHVAQAHHMISPMASHKTPEEEAPLQRFSERKHAEYSEGEGQTKDGEVGREPMRH